MRRTFVTGANGFIGSHLVGALLERGDHVTGLVRPTSDLRSLASLFERYRGRLRVVVGDLRQPASLGAGLEDAEMVFHLGAVLMATSEEDFTAVITRGTENLLERVAALRPGRLERFVFVSSLAAAGPPEEGTSLVESRPPRPVSWYGAAKAKAEAIARRFGEQGLPVTIVRPVAVYGEREQDLSGGTFGPVSMGLLPRIGLRDKTVCFVHVRDLVQGILSAAESPKAVGQTYFLSDPSPYRSSEVVRAVADALGTKVRIPLLVPHMALQLAAVGSEWAHHFTRARPMITRDKVREVRQRSWACSAEAARNDFGWQPAFDLRSGMPSAVADWRQRVQDRQAAYREPPKARAIKTYTLAVLLGITVESLARLGNWYRFDPWWSVFVVIVGVFGGIMGTLCYLSVRWPAWAQFLAGAAIGIGAELLNAFWLQAWTFNPETLGRIPGPWLRSIAVGLPAGLMPVLINRAIRALYARRLRLG